MKNPKFLVGVFVGAVGTVGAFAAGFVWLVADLDRHQRAVRPVFDSEDMRAIRQLDAPHRCAHANHRNAVHGIAWPGEGSELRGRVSPVQPPLSAGGSTTGGVA